MTKKVRNYGESAYDDEFVGTENSQPNLEENTVPLEETPVAVAQDATGIELVDTNTSATPVAPVINVHTNATTASIVRNKPANVRKYFTSK